VCRIFVGRGIACLRLLSRREGCACEVATHECACKCTVTSARQYADCGIMACRAFGAGRCTAVLGRNTRVAVCRGLWVLVSVLRARDGKSCPWCRAYRGEQLVASSPSAAVLFELYASQERPDPDPQPGFDVLGCVIIVCFWQTPCLLPIVAFRCRSAAACMLHICTTY
jgi:hypothetical protein